MKTVWLRHLLSTALVVGLVSLAGCSAINVKLGRRVDLTKTPVTSIEVSLPKGPGIAPGQKLPLVVTAMQANGKPLLTEGAGKGKIQWKDLKVTPAVVTADAKGNILLARDPRVSDGKSGHVTISVPSQPGIASAELEIPFRYNVAFNCNFSGATGSSGNSGFDGQAGSPGSMGSTDPNNPSPGGNGGNGTDGSNGGDGGPGGNAPPVQVQMTLQAGAQLLVQVEVSASGKKRYYLVDPSGGSLAVRADGGAGGTGGRGGRGGSGGSGGIGSPSGSSGSSGQDGRNGDDGSMGRGGLITVLYDPATKPYLSVLHLSSKNGPTPTYQQQSIPLLWIPGK
jgi:hypothetical protein